MRSGTEEFLFVAPPATASPAQPDSATALLLVTGSIATATNGQRRKGKSMSRRSGQAGTVVKAGKFYRVRFRIDVPNGRIQRSVMLCPADPQAVGYLNKPQRQRRAVEVVEQAGANSAEVFKQIVAVESGTTFQHQAERWLHACETRKRKPVAPSTLETWRSALNKWLLPALGDVPLAAVNNPTLKTLVAGMDDAKPKLSAKSINNYVQIVKMVVASATDENGEPMYPRKWNHQFIDLPRVEKSKQHAPCFSADTITALVAAATEDWECMLYVLCAASGLRIGEALGLDICKHVSPDGSTIQIRQKVRKCRIESSLKTKNAEREIDLHPSVASLLQDFIGTRKGLLFPTRRGKPMSDSNFRNRFLYIRLKALGQPKAGAHAFRRFRNTFLRKVHCSEGLIKFWMGHAGQDMSDLYDKIREDIQYRKDVAESVGIGFELPKTTEVVPCVPWIGPKNSVEVFA